MVEFKLSPFRTTRIVQSLIQELLDAVSMAILAYQEGMIAYLKEGWAVTTEDKQQQLAAFESTGDSLRSNIGLTLYTEMLLPDTSADILSLLSDLDHMLDRMRRHFTLLGIGKPEFPANSSEVMIDFTSHACSAMEHTVAVARSFKRFICRKQALSGLLPAWRSPCNDFYMFRTSGLREAERLKVLPFELFSC
ncbi:MAG: DUF47 family protein [Methylobacter sp.]|uniref:DUF47 family protein n=1 Tax=Methylobacter sp. TaxID=2051955 RepID=UPI002730ACE0|nr:DUF47 family protein [Methylobacter sp.]MDP1665331.1 DUF47 family protein [Methylobacter sp.]